MGSKKIVSIPLLIAGLFVIYIAALDDALFSLVRSAAGTDRLGIAIATTVAAAVPMFFAVGMIRKSIGINWFTIYHYERILDGKGFWVIAIIVLLLVAILHLVTVVPQLIAGVEFYLGGITIVGCIISVICLAVYISKINKKSYETEAY